MRILKMQPKFLEVFLESTQKYGSLYGPTKKNNVLVYDRITNVKDLVLSDDLPTIPVKKLFHHKQFDMFKFSPQGFTADYSTNEKRVLIGIHPCEIHSLLTLDRIFNKPPEDPYYTENRKDTVIIGFSCLPTENCLCKYTQTDRVDEGFDLFFVNLDTFYLVWVGSSTGYDLIHEKEEFFDENVSPEDMQKYIEWRKKRDVMFTKEYNFYEMADIMDLNYNSKVWDYFADKCLSCGQCSMVCPTCNCYNVVDVFEISNQEAGRRERIWDSCMFSDYSLTAGGHNFRGSRADRLKLWYTHKLKAFGGRFGKPGCVGCGRCVETCPVDINVLTISKALTTNEVPRQ